MTSHRSAADIVRLEPELVGPDAAPALGRHPIFNGRPSRRAALKTGVLVAATTLTARVAGIVPMGRAAATHSNNTTYGYRIQGDCGGMSWYNNSNESCTKPCGPSTIFSDACESSGHNVGFHKNNGTCNGCYTLRPGQCSGDDGWKWNHQGCSPCSPTYTTTHFRCHDGWKNYDGQQPRNSSICRWVVTCQN